MTTALRALELHLVGVEDLHDPRGRCRHQDRVALEQEAGVQRVEAVDVLGGIDGPDHAVLVDLVGQRELDEDAGHPLVGVEVADEGEELVLARRHVELVVERLDAGLGAGLPLAPDVDV